MYDESVFGPLASYSEDAILADPRRDRWGHIPLCSGVVWMGHDVRNVPVVPPAYRRFVRLPPSVTHAKLRRARDEMLVEWDSSANEVREAGLWNSHQDRPISDEEILALPGELDECQLAQRYRFIININAQLKRMIEIGPPSIILERLEARLLDGVHDVFEQIAVDACLPAAIRAMALRFSHAPHQGVPQRSHPEDS